MNDTRMWCSTILASAAMISLAIMNTGNTGYAEYCMFGCTIVGLIGLGGFLGRISHHAKNNPDS